MITVFGKTESKKWYLHELLISCAASLFAVALFFSSVFSQAPTEAALRIERINVDNLPLVQVLLRSENLDEDISELLLSVSEDGIDRAIVSSMSNDIGMQIALIIDPALDLSLIGNSGDPFRFDIANGASALIESGILSARSDWLAAFAPSDTSTTVQRVTEWQRDHQGVVNTLYQIDSTDVLTDAALDSLLDNVISDSINADIPGALKRVLVVFTDGTSVLDNRSVNRIISNAQADDISINVIMLGDGSTDSQQNLERIVSATDGQYLSYESKDSLLPLWSRLEAQTSSYEITYKLGQAQPSQVAVMAALANGDSVVATEDFPGINLSPVQIMIEVPGVDEVITRTSESADAGLAELLPRTLPVQIAFDWSDEIERDIQSVEFTIGDSITIQNEPPFTSYELPIVDLDKGSYSLSVTATDELGIVSNIEQQSFRIEVTRPETVSIGNEVTTGETMSEEQLINDSAPASTPVDVQQIGNKQGMNILGIQLPETIDIFGVTFLVNGITLLIALFPLIFLLALLLYWLTQRNEKVSEPDYGYYEYDNNGYFYRFEPAMDDMQLTQPEVSVLETGDELTMPVQLPSFYTGADAYLVYVSGGDHLPKKLPVEANEPVRIGRKKSFCDQILDDQRVSRLHSVITNEGGSFYIKDEGSSGGTFVNRRKLSPTDKQLIKDSDIINFNEVEYRFEIAKTKGGSASPALSASAVNRPEPLLPNSTFE